MPVTESTSGGVAAESLEYEADVQLAQLQRDLIALEELEPDWDSYGGQVPSKRTITQASHFLRPIVQLLLNYVGESGLPSVYPMPDGSVELEWSDRSGTGSVISVVVGPDNSLSYFKRIEQNEEVQYGEGPLDSPSDFVQMIFESMEHGQ
jgi:hypothetical protein